MNYSEKWDTPGQKNNWPDSPSGPGYVPLSRMFSFALSAAALLVLLFAVDLTITHLVFDASTWTDTGSKPLVRWGFLVGVSLVSSLIIWRQWSYIVGRVPTLLCAWEPGIAFGVGLNYAPFFVPWKYAKQAEIIYGFRLPFMALAGVTLDRLRFAKEQRRRLLENEGTLLGKILYREVGFSVTFTESTLYPASLATSAGLRYSTYRLKLSMRYYKGNTRKIVEEINKRIAANKVT
ncbi:MAG: hypothetical protein COW24_00950 [Candidatus Kerfeldbacteria bacterium CG15_BIG_FIL_POST_REV_8_21_14_020_45_12]|uniref:Uncharacterized protein n=1 Tax=Candidatus Kerfeldbacteria bacterium CG15_BIG_FIL_POST_REV_8_21_14_020_45_12 TaxID=2014247 RepID=A0A2M7H4V1_9BACT|nr:MAG: hypothetical protein COW24_00950 [Candidatus Kerfeldbacteria bacterium CG15_BIG_FIL_POST_REV_8_21_14_020_45_12]PJA93158.1 MAG: hypothetical protein CO132_04210 [Candidatus Kerfeldbacteria bacterium CG_4_9_14_3_um_filter_45_8]